MHMVRFEKSFVLVAILSYISSVTKEILYIPNGCLDAYEVKVNIYIFKYQEKVKLI